MSDTPIYDRNGYLILPGDLVRIHHYRHRTLGHQYLWFVVGEQCGKLFIYRWDLKKNPVDPEYPLEFSRQTTLANHTGDRFQLFTEIMDFGHQIDRDERKRDLPGLRDALAEFVKREGAMPAGFPTALAKRLKWPKSQSIT